MKKVGILFIGLLFILVAVAGCARTGLETMTPPEQTAPPLTGDMSFTLTSTAFADGAEIPVKYSCNGQNISPALDWSGSPAGTASFALIMDDLDAVYTHWVIFNLPPDIQGLLDAVYTHWVIFNLPPDIQGLPEAVPKDEELADGALQGKTGSGGVGYPTGYFGPCPPKGPPHHYRFTLYALDTLLDLTAGASKAELLQAIQGHILGQAQLIGIYKR
jgi:Raf kinase inhibitor-like YbhB/YbcL family protein